jgi:hypothetical protein
MRRTLLIVLAVLVTVLGLGTAVVATSGDSSTITKPRLERSLPATFSHLYVQQAKLLGRPGITAKSLHAKAMCDKAGAKRPDAGPGSDWVCLMSWHDPQNPMPTEGYGKFEINVHSNDCYTAGGPSKLTGFLTLTDKTGKEVTNPLFEFDSCFDPHGDNTPTGHKFPSVIAVLGSSVRPDAQGKAGVQLSCGTGSGGCVGTIRVSAGSTHLGSIPFRLDEETTKTLPIPTAIPAGAKEVDFTIKSTSGIATSSPTTLPVEGG